MTKEQFDKLYLDKVVHCPTEEKAKEFLALADSVGYRWVSSKSLLKKLAWEQYEKETCYEVKKFGFMFGSTESFGLEGAQIIEYPQQSRFKQGDEDINSIIEELKENQKRTTVLLNRLEQEVKNK